MVLTFFDELNSLNREIPEKNMTKFKYKKIHKTY